MCSLQLQVLERLSFGESSVGEALSQEIRIALVWYWLTYVILKRNKAKYQTMEAPSSVSPHKLKIEEVHS